MMLLYDKLYCSTDVDEISVAQYLAIRVDEIILNFPNTQVITVEKHIDDFMLDLAYMQPRGIVVNKLLTYIMKYAFIGKTEDRIIFSATAEEKHISLIITENGNGMPESVSFENSNDFRLMLVNGMTDQLNGAMGIERGEGTKIILEFNTQ